MIKFYNLEKYMKINKMNKKQFAKFLEISYYSLTKIFNQKNVGLRFIIKIIRKLNLKPSEFYLFRLFILKLIIHFNNFD